MEFAGIAKWMRMHEVHRITTVKSMAGISHPGEVIGDSAWQQHGALMARDQPTRPWSADATVRAQQSFAVFGDSYPETRDRFTRDIAAIDGVLPDRQPRAGCPQVAITSE
jgi:hypothetical protein